jgi:nucleotide-binding universal stress UspA family protein
MMERLVVPIDVGHDGQQAIPVARSLAERGHASVELVTVVEPAEDRHAARLLRGLAERHGGGITTRVVATGGPPEAALLTELHADDKSLWCVGTRARGPIAEILFGSLSEDLVRDAHVPIMLVGPQATAPVEGDVLAVALDGTAPAEAALPTAWQLGSALGMTLRLLQVVEAGAGEDAPDVAETAYLARVAKRLVRGADADYEVLHASDVGRELTRYVERQPEVALLAMSSRGLKGVARLVHGGHAFELARHARTPVLALHPVA